jgi:hypothetical protein
MTTSFLTKLINDRRAQNDKRNMGKYCIRITVKRYVGI